MSFIINQILGGKGHFHHKIPTVLEHGTRRWKGGSSLQVSTPTPAPAPSTADAVNAWVSSMPQVFAEQQRQAPLEAQQQLELAQQYALPLAQAMQSADSALYPQTAALQENMAGQATEGMNATSMPDWMSKNYRSDMNAQLGQNSSAPIGADYVSRGMQDQLFQQQKYYRVWMGCMAGSDWKMVCFRISEFT